jgi:hypothetical protein
MAEQKHSFNYSSNLSADCESTFLNCISQNDVLLGRGGGSNNHIGNRRFRAIVSQHQHEYRQTRKLDKSKVAQKIVDIVQQEGGRFLKRTESNSAWEQVNRRQALSKTSQALREGLDVRNSNSKKSSEPSTVTDCDKSSTKTRKPYTIKQQTATGEVKRAYEDQSTVASSSRVQSTITHPVRTKSVEEEAAVAIASLHQNVPIVSKEEDEIH